MQRVGRKWEPDMMPDVIHMTAGTPSADTVLLPPRNFPLISVL